MRELYELEIKQVAGGGGPITDLPEIQEIKNVLENGSWVESAASFPAANMLGKVIGGAALSKTNAPTPGVGAATVTVGKTLDVFDHAFTSISNNLDSLLDFS